MNKQLDLFDGVVRDSKGKSKKWLGPYTKQFEQWWNLYPLKVGKRAAFAAFLRALQYVAWEELMRKTLFLSETDKARGQYCPHPSTFLNQQRWDDDPKAWMDNRGVNPRETVDWNYKA